MVSSLRYYDSDPNGAGRGAGKYYHRGKGHYSKYDPARDRAHASVNSRGRPTKNITKTQAGTYRHPGNWAHTGDAQKYW